MNLDWLNKHKPKYNPDVKLFAPENRGFLMLSSIALVLIVCLILWLFSSGDEEKKKSVIVEDIDVKVQNPTADSQVSAQYKRSIQELNKEEYQKASKKVEGASMPIVYHDKPDTEAGSIEGCGCTFDENAKQALIEELRKLGINSIGQRDGLRLGKSDVYVQTDGMIIDENGNPYLWNGQPIKTSDTGIIQFVDSGMPIEVDNDQSVYLSSEGKFYNQATSVVRLFGRVLSKDGVILLGTGMRANRPGGMKQIDDSDVYVTSDAQLATIDGKPVYHSANFVFKDLQSRLHNSYNEDVTWEEKTVFQNENGVLQGRAGRQFSRIGILISHGGILIDNNSMLTEDLNDFKRFGTSDLFINSENFLVDSFGSKATHKGYEIKVGTNNSVISEVGPVKNSSGMPLFIKETGRFYADKPVYLTGTVKNSQGVAYDRFGHQISRVGKLTRLGESAIWNTADRYLATQNGHSIYYNGKDVFQDISRFKVINGVEAYGIKSGDGEIIYDILGREVFLNENGELIYEDGQALTQSGLLTNSENVLITSNGELIVDEAKLERVVDGSGNPLFYNGEEVYKGKDGRLYDKQGNVLLSENGRAIHMNEQGTLVDENGNVFAENLLSRLSPASVNSGFKVQPNGEVVDENGNPIYFNGSKVVRGSDGKLYDQSGNLLADEKGNPLKFNEEGQIVNSDGNPTSLDGFTTAKTKTVHDTITDNAGFETTSDGQLVNENGDPVLYKGKKVYKGDDGKLYDESGNLITDELGRALALGADGIIVGPEGEPAELNGFKVAKSSVQHTPIGNGGFYTDDSGQVLNEDGQPVFFKGKEVFRGADGKLYDSSGNALTDVHGKPLTLDSSGVITNSDGTPVPLDGFEVLKKVKGSNLESLRESKLRKIGEDGIYSTADGMLLDRNGKPLTYKGKRLRRAQDGQLFDENGQPIIDSLGNPLYMNEDGEVVDVDGKPVEKIHFLNGDGQYLSGDGSTPQVKRVGNSDVYLTREGLVTDEQGRPLLFNGKPVKVGAGGRLITTDGEFVTDAKGNSTYLTNDGSLKNREGEPSKGSVLVDADGVTLDAQGKRVTNGGKLTEVSEGVFRTADGLLVSRDGKAVLIDGKQAFIGDEGQIVDANGRALRHQGRRLFLSNTGDLLDAQGSAITSDNQAVALTSKGLTKEDGTLVTTPQSNQALQSRTTPSRKIREQFDASKQASVETQPSPSAADPNPTSEVKVHAKKAAQAVPAELASVIDVESLTQEEIIRLNQRYAQIYQGLESKLSEYEADFRSTPKSSIAEFAPVDGAADTTQPTLNQDSSMTANHGMTQGAVLLKQQAGTVLYAANTMTVNTDLNTRVVFNIMGLSHTHPFYRATAQGKVALRYDHIVIEFDQLCPEFGDCYAIQGIAVDPTTKSASINGDIDKHYWYRFGGLALATLTQGAAIAVGESRERTEQYDEQGKVVTYSGLDGTELLVRSAEPLGSALANVFMENVNRPYTGTIANGEEVGIFLFEDVVLREGEHIPKK